MAQQPTPIAAVILAAGKGTRMKSALPKVMSRAAAVGRACSQPRA